MSYQTQHSYRLNRKCSPFRDNTVIPFTQYKTLPLEILTVEPIRYGLDKVEMVSKLDTTDVRKAVNALGPFSRSLVSRVRIVDIDDCLMRTARYRNLYKQFYNDGHRTLVRIVRPTPEFFQRLQGNEKFIGKPIEVELCSDIVTPSKEVACQAVNRLIDSTILLYDMNRHVFLFDRHDETRYSGIKDKSKTLAEHESYLEEQRKRLGSPKHDIFGNRTLYLGNGDLVYKIYARRSKLDGLPVARREFRISGNNLRKLLGIRKEKGSYLQALKNLSGLRSSKVFLQLHDTYIKYCEINRLAVAKHFLGWSAKKILTVGEAAKLSLHYEHFKRCYRIETAAELFRHGSGLLAGYRRFLTHVDLITASPSK